jgi:hypothetical protein
MLLIYWNGYFGLDPAARNEAGTGAGKPWMPGGAFMMAIPDDISGSQQKSPVAASASVPTGTIASPSTVLASGRPPNTAPAPVGSGLRITAVVFRTAFIFVLMALVMRVAQPQSETIWTAYETPGDLIRLWLGIGVCIWLLWQLFEGPKDAHGYRAWLYLGVTALPFSLFCLFATW